MIIVSDTSPINYLLLIGLVDLLPQLYGEVIIPAAVYAELQHPGAPQVVKEWIANQPDWVEVRLVPSPDPTLELGEGEKEAITLALTLKADALLIDERKGRREAVARGLAVSGTLNILETAAERGLIDLPQAFSLLLNTSFRASVSILQEMLRRDAGRKHSTSQPEDDN
jgi:predicted nucleic acid-binding protein